MAKKSGKTLQKEVPDHPHSIDENRRIQTKGKTEKSNGRFFFIALQLVAHPKTGGRGGEG